PAALASLLLGALPIFLPGSPQIAASGWPRQLYRRGDAGSGDRVSVADDLADQLDVLRAFGEAEQNVRPVLAAAFKFVQPIAVFGDRKSTRQNSSHVKI